MIVFYKCTGCGDIGNFDSKELEYIQSKPHNYFWNGPARCEGYSTIPSSKHEWEQQKGRSYPQDLLEKYK